MTVCAICCITALLICAKAFILSAVSSPTPWVRTPAGARDRIKLLHWEPGGMVLYSKLLEAGTLGKPDSANDNEVCTNIEWRELVMIVEGIMEARDSRRTRLENLQKLRK